MKKIKRIYQIGLVVGTLLATSPTMAKSILRTNQEQLAFNANNLVESYDPKQAKNKAPDYLQQLLGNTIYTALLHSDEFITLEGWFNFLAQPLNSRK